MTGYSWTVVINKLPYGQKAKDPWTAVSRALRQYCKEHPQSSMTLFDIYLINRTLEDKGKTITSIFGKHRKELLEGGDQFGKK